MGVVGLKESGSSKFQESLNWRLGVEYYLQKPFLDQAITKLTDCRLV